MEDYQVLPLLVIQLKVLILCVRLELNTPRLKCKKASVNPLKFGKQMVLCDRCDQKAFDELHAIFIAGDGVIIGLLVLLGVGREVEVGGDRSRNGVFGVELAGLWLVAVATLDWSYDRNRVVRGIVWLRVLLFNSWQLIGKVRGSSCVHNAMMVGRKGRARSGA